MGSFHELVRSVNIECAVQRAFSIHKQVTLKSPAKPFELVKNSGLFLIHYGFGVYWCNGDCLQKTQDSLVGVYEKMDKGKYVEYQGLDALLQSFRGTTPPWED